MNRMLVIFGVVILALVAALIVWFVISLRGPATDALEAKYMTADDRYVSVAGAQVRVREEGPADAPPVILIHGFTSSLETVERVHHLAGRSLGLWRPWPQPDGRALQGRRL